jgi:hypothetical protein
MSLDGLVTGRIVYYVFDAQDADAINRRRTTSEDIAARIAKNTWPLGAQAHIGTPVNAGDVQPAQVVRVHDAGAGVVNLSVALDGSDTYWVTDVAYSEDARPGTWHWMYQGQGTRGSAR